MRDVREPTRFSLWNASCLLLAKETNKSKTEVQKELSAARPGRAFQRPFTKEAGWRLTFHLAAWLGWSGSSGYPATPRAPAVARTQLAAGGRFPVRGVPKTRCRVGADRKGRSPRPAGARGYSGAGWRRL